MEQMSIVRRYTASIDACTCSRKVLYLLFILIMLISMSCQKDAGRNDAETVSRADSHTPGGSTFKIRYRPQWLHQAQFAGIYMAYKKGFYRDYGLNVEIQQGGMDFPAYESIQKGSSDITQLFLITALSRDNEASHLVNLAQVSQKSSLMLVGKKARGMEKIGDLRKRKIGLWRNDFRDLSLIFIQQNKLDMEIVNVDWSVNLFLKDVIDVMNVMRYNEYHQLIQAGIDPDELFQISFSDIGMNIIEDGLYCTKEFYARYPQQCRDFAQATMDGWLYAINHQEETVDTVLDIMQTNKIPANRTHQAWMLKVMREVIMANPHSIGILREDDFNEVLQLLKQQGRPYTNRSFREFAPHAN